MLPREVHPSNPLSRLLLKMNFGLPSIVNFLITVHAHFTSLTEDTLHTLFLYFKYLQMQMECYVRLLYRVMRVVRLTRKWVERSKAGSKVDS